MPYERHVFRQLAPNQEETADKFMVRVCSIKARKSIGKFPLSDLCLGFDSTKLIGNKYF